MHQGVTARDDPRAPPNAAWLALHLQVRQQLPVGGGGRLVELVERVVGLAPHALAHRRRPAVDRLLEASRPAEDASDEEQRVGARLPPARLETRLLQQPLGLGLGLGLGFRLGLG